MITVAVTGTAVIVSTAAMNSGDSGSCSDDDDKKYKKEKRRKPGKRGEFKGKDALRAENKMARDAAREAGLDSKEQQRILHDLISGQDLSYKEILEVAKMVKRGIW